MLWEILWPARDQAGVKNQNTAMASYEINNYMTQLALEDCQIMQFFVLRIFPSVGLFPSSEMGSGGGFLRLLKDVSVLGKKRTGL